MTARADALRADLRALAWGWERAAAECERLANGPRAGLSDAADLRAGGIIFRKRADELAAVLDAHEPATEPDLVTLTPEQVERFANAADAALRVRRAVLLLAAHATGGHVKQPHGDRCDDCGLTWPCVTVLRAAGPALNAIANLPSQEPATACRDAETATEREAPRIEDVLAAHQTRIHPHCWECSCGTSMNFDRTLTPYASPDAHVAQAIREAAAS